MELETIIKNATDDEARALLAAVRRANAKPAVLVTVEGGRRYVVAQEDEDEIRPLVGRDPEEWQRSWGGFGARWMRGYGRVDEMHRTISLSDVVKVAEADRARVWGT